MEEILTSKIEWDECIVEKHLVLTKIPTSYEFLNLEIKKGTKFNDIMWDFTEYNVKSQSPSMYKFNFKNIDTAFRNYAKTYVLRALHQGNRTISTIYGILKKIESFCKFLSEQGILYFELINTSEIFNFIASLGHVRESTKMDYKNAISNLLAEIAFKNPTFDFSDVFSSLESYDVEKYRAEREEGKWPLIPFHIAEKIQNLALDDMDNSSLDLIDRMSASMILILSETGMRNMEFQNLRAGSLKKILLKSKEDEVTTKEFEYLEFMTFKTVKEVHGRLTRTYMTPKAIKAYKWLETVLGDKRTSDNFLYCGNTGMAISSSTISRHIRRFFFRHKEALGLDRLPQEERKCFIEWTIVEYDVKRIPGVTDDNIGEIVYIVVPHQFRVLVVNVLYKKGYHLLWIKEHMNHMSAQMTEHYLRVEKDKKQKQLQIETLLNRSSATGLLETDSNNTTKEFIKEELNDEGYNKAYKEINNFLIQNKLNLFKDLKDIIEKMSIKKIPIIEGEMGFCLSQSFLKLCQRQEYISSISDGYSLGIMLPVIEELPFSYKRFEEKVLILQHNESLMKTNKKFEREFQKERNSLNQFINKKLLLEFNELKQQVTTLNPDVVLEIYPDLKFIVENLNTVEEEILSWSYKTSPKV